MGGGDDDCDSDDYNQNHDIQKNGGKENKWRVAIAGDGMATLRHFSFAAPVDHAHDLGSNDESQMPYEVTLHTFSRSYNTRQVKWTIASVFREERLTYQYQVPPDILMGQNITGTNNLISVYGDHYYN